jgi:imidazolonepropionase-like amidohydrolase
MTQLQALQSATVTAAEVLGLGYDIGKIEVGYAADLIAVKGDPIKDITLLESPSIVIKSGIRYR